MKTSRLNGGIGLLFGFSISGFLLYFSLRDVNWNELCEAFATAKYLPVVFSAGAISVSILLRGFRWRIISGHPAQDHPKFRRATNLGIFTNLVLPARAGEFLRIFMLVRSTGRSVSDVLASVLVDRCIDILVLLICASSLVAFLPFGNALKKWLFYFVAVAPFLLILIYVYARGRLDKIKWVSKLMMAWKRKWGIDPIELLGGFQRELDRLVRNWLSVEIFAIASIILFCDYSAVLGILIAFNVPLVFEAPLLLWVLFAIGSSIPAAPGYVGVYQGAAVLALSFYSVSDSVAVAVGTTLQLVTIVVALLFAVTSIAELRELKIWASEA